MTRIHEDRLQDLADALREEKELQKCFRHGSPVFYDAPDCPACLLLQENGKPPDKVWRTK
jgi:hypothetical protein